MCLSLSVVRSTTLPLVAESAKEAGEAPFGALLADADGNVLLQHANAVEANHDATDHDDTDADNDDLPGDRQTRMDVQGRVCGRQVSWPPALACSCDALRCLRSHACLPLFAFLSGSCSRALARALALGCAR